MNYSIEKHHNLNLLVNGDECRPATDAEVELVEELNCVRAQLASAERERPEWAKGYGSVSVAAQVSTAALMQLWDLLGVSDQTAAVAKLGGDRYFATQYVQRAANGSPILTQRPYAEWPEWADSINPVRKDEATFNKAKEALIKIRKKYGIEPAAEILHRYGYLSIAAVRPAHYAALIADADAYMLTRTGGE